MHYHQFLDAAELGGGTLYALAVADRLKATACRVTAWVGGHGPASAECDRRGLAHDRYDQPGLRSGGLRAAVELARLWVRLRGRGNLVHVHSCPAYGVTGRVWRRTAARTVGHVHSQYTPDDYRWAFRDPPHAIVTCAGFLVKQVEAALPADTLRRIRLMAIPNAVDVGRFFPGDKATAKQAVSAPTDRPMVLMAANLAEFKGQLTAIRAMQELRQLGTDAELWLAGIERGGVTTFTDRVTALIAELGLGDRVRLLGQRADMPDLMRAADAVVLPSATEGLPLTLLEAQASGAPVLAAPVGGIPEIVADESTGFLVAADDHVGYARRLHELLRDTAAAARLTAAALEQIRAHHTWDQLFARLRGVYDDVLAG
ncbi:MAG: glycosyltransferase family 4 protein [Fimbriiglobus sp.]|jgi:glycosyltransferase involved in cell wall biosynthesis|nr:glycosyltransferase family 4 protein [Fimbriiglobus sp.]